MFTTYSKKSPNSNNKNTLVFIFHRNCLLCDNNVVKITDVAMGISLFNSDYSEVRGRSCAPIRWQPWETLLLVRKAAAFHHIRSTSCNVISSASLINHRAVIFAILTSQPKQYQKGLFVQ